MSKKDVQVVSNVLGIMQMTGCTVVGLKNIPEELLKKEHRRILHEVLQTAIATKYTWYDSDFEDIDTHDVEEVELDSVDEVTTEDKYETAVDMDFNTFLAGMLPTDSMAKKLKAILDPEEK